MSIALGTTNDLGTLALCGNIRAPPLGPVPCWAVTSLGTGTPPCIIHVSFFFLKIYQHHVCILKIFILKTKLKYVVLICGSNPVFTQSQVPDRAAGYVHARPAHFSAETLE